MRRIAYRTLDVFAERPLEGNPLAVVPDAGGLTDDEMRSVTREFNLSETTFALRRPAPVEAERGIHTRIFTIDRELPFAGHPALGTAAALRGDGNAAEVVLELAVGRMPVRLRSEENGLYAEMTQRDPVFGKIHDPAEVARALGVGLSDLETRYPIQTVSTGNPFVIVLFRGLASLQAWQPSWPRMAAWLAGTDASFVYAISPETVQPDRQLHARMPFPGGEDPATGSAAGPAVAWLLRHGLVGPDEWIDIEQGLEVHRPSRLRARAGQGTAGVHDVRVGGHVHPVAEGTLTLP